MNLIRKNMSPRIKIKGKDVEKTRTSVNIEVTKGIW